MLSDKKIIVTPKVEYYNKKYVEVSGAEIYKSSDVKEAVDELKKWIIKNGEKYESGEEGRIVSGAILDEIDEIMGSL